MPDPTIDYEELAFSYIREQQNMTAVEVFSKQHEQMHGQNTEGFYRNLIPLETPKEGQQYSFEVDLSACTGCKACVTACHSLNGLDDDETWRHVGLVHGGTEEAPVQQTVTTACHHCLDPGCMNGCPVKAYEKDDVTGIVKHLDDQCIGCQYCILKCPYEVPQYSKERGIVRKCDMCTDRLSEGEAPACVQSCPNDAIKIKIVDKSRIEMINSVHNQLPHTPDDECTTPTTQFIRNEALPSNSLPVDFYSSKPKDPHLPLVIGLVLTQLSVGVLIGEWICNNKGYSQDSYWLSPVTMILSVLTVLVAIAASTMHLGRPLYAFRAVLGLKTSWLSREVVAFGIYMKALVALAVIISAPVIYEYAGWQIPLIEHVESMIPALRVGTIFVGLLGILCSVMIYHDTKKEMWNFYWSAPKFFLTAATLGISAMTVIILFTNKYATSAVDVNEMIGLGIFAVVIKLLYESTLFLSLKDPHNSIEKRTSQLVLAELKKPLICRYLFGIVGGIILPLVVQTQGHPYLALVALLLLVFSELAERYLFFTGIVSHRMPGSVAA